MTDGVSNLKTSFACIKLYDATLAMEGTCGCHRVGSDGRPPLGTSREHLKDSGRIIVILIEYDNAHNLLIGNQLTKAIPASTCPDVDVDEIVEVDGLLGPLDNGCCLPLPSPIALPSTNSICQ